MSANATSLNWINKVTRVYKATSSRMKEIRTKQLEFLFFILVYVVEVVDATVETLVDIPPYTMRH